MTTTGEAIRARQQARRERALARIKASKVPSVAEVVEEPSYRDLQAQAKELDIPANQTADDLKAAIEEAEAAEETEDEEAS
jgi:allophanate hydrolase subunit 1